MDELKTLYDDAGFLYIPLNGKRPMTPAWQDIKKSLPIRKGQNIGIVCGKESNITVVDIDTKDKGMEIWNRIIALLDVPLTPTVVTGSGGLHLYFKWDIGVKTGAKCVTVDWGEVREKIGIDIRSEKGQVVAPPSIHPDTQVQYSWKIAPDLVEPHYMPAILKELLTSKKMLKFNHATQTFKIVSFRESTKRQISAEDTKTFEFEGGEKLRAVVMNLSISRADDRDDWIKVLFAIGQVARENDVDLSELAIDFSKKSAKFENEAEALEKYNSPGLGITPKTLFWMLKKDNPDVFKKLCGGPPKKDKVKLFDDMLKQIMADSVAPADIEEVKEEVLEQDEEQGEEIENEEDKINWQFCDYKKFLSGEIKPTRVLEYMREAIPHVINKGADIVFSKNILDDGSTCYYPIAFPFIGVNNFPIEFNGALDMMDKIYTGVYLTNSYHYMDFVPYLDIDPTPPTTFNIFEGFKYKHGEFTAAMEGKIQRIMYHITTIISGNDPVVAEYLLDWIAQIFQRPDDKIGIAVLLKSTRQGAGKNVFTDFIIKLLGKGLTYTTDRLDDLTNKFNAYMQGKLLVVCDEVANYAGYKLADSLKSNITCTHRPIEVKGKEVFSIACRARYIFTSNSDIPLRISQYDRRYLAIEVSDEKVGDRLYFSDLIEEMNDEESMRAFFLYMTNRDISDRVFRNIPVTALKKELMAESIPSPIQYVMDVGAGEREEWLGEFTNKTLKVFYAGFFEDYNRWMAEGKYTGTTNKRAFNKKISEVGLITKSTRIGGRVARGIVINEVELLASFKRYMKDVEFSFRGY
jgi:hypothetical protein